MAVSQCQYLHKVGLQFFPDTNPLVYINECQSAHSTSQQFKKHLKFAAARGLWRPRTADKTINIYTHSQNLLSNLHTHTSQVFHLWWGYSSVVEHQIAVLTSANYLRVRCSSQRAPCFLLFFCGKGAAVTCEEKCSFVFLCSV